MKPFTHLGVAILTALLGAALSPAFAADPPTPTDVVLASPSANGVLPPSALPASHQRSGLEVYQRFRDGLADPECDSAATNGRWKKQFGHAPGQLARAEDDLLPLFGYVVDALREAHLPTEFALIPFVESGYKPGARNPNGPAGLWQFIGITARNHGVPMREGYDGRLSPVDSTQAAVRYLKTLHGMFGGDWRLAVMAYNAGEYRVLQSMRRAGMNARNARPAELPGLSGITYAYVEKLHALACIFQQADDRDAWLDQLDRPVPRLAAHPLPEGGTLASWASMYGQSEKLLNRLNPALAGRFSRGSRPMRLLAPSLAVEAGGANDSTATNEQPSAPRQDDPAKPSERTHTVKSGESAWSIGKRHGIPAARLLRMNGLKSGAVLRPGMVLQLDEASSEAP
ncbi:MULTISPECIES: lytic transglycosylase domain-containing protein [unclassified Pseudoxanthomonas]|uniref:lytic transglycosylase domain-containing protein n=1 Tax=unclassified Pseudoxanthomonas TaxID=2645906 RepID=UPI0008EF7608|nr:MULTISPECIES: lytic transglycosylase domain-containing protein [unclassified Pseudoxanthomonas]PPJ42302.1 LysM peptidoglycan-binding domain-containing protein [Pseudoxanthomonas sp. KAs_5_3]SFV27830.1 membrane-bound lytic murein transglycosylase D [Pseudoxanthomonas sp. YR558]